MEAGIYLIEVHSDTDIEDYTLAIGNVERFGAVEILKTILVLPVMKALFWNSYLMIGVYIIILGVIIFVIYKLM